MTDEFIDALKNNEAVLVRLDDKQIEYLALSEILSEMAVGRDVPQGLKVKRISLSAELAKRAGVKW